jgi:DNA polymerase-3 subunit delta
MPTVDVNQAIRSIASNKTDSVYLLVGEERYFSDRCVSQLRHHVVTEDLREFNEDIFYASETPIDKVIDALQTLPVMAEKRLVILKEAQLLNEKDWQELERIEPHKSPTAVLTLVAESLDRRKKAVKKWFDLATVIECQVPQENARAGWIRSLASEKGLELDQEALAYLVQMGGNTLEELDRDLDKVFLFFGKPMRLSIGDVAKVLDRSREQSIFSLAESIGKKDRTQALYLYHCLSEQGESEIALVALIARHLRILLKVLEAQALGVRGAALAGKVGVNSYFLQGYVQQASMWSQVELADGILSLAEMDRQLKSSSLPAELWMERFLLFVNDRTKGSPISR